MRLLLTVEPCTSGLRVHTNRKVKNVKAEEKKEFELKSSGDLDVGLEGFIDVVRETNDEVLQVEELRIHTERLKGDLIQYFIDIMEKYDLELTISAESFSFKEDNGGNLQAVFVNDSGIISYHFKDGFVKSYRLSDYPPSELLTLFSVVMANLKDALEVKRREYEKMSNTLSKVKRYMTLLKEKLTETNKHESPSQDKL